MSKEQYLRKLRSLIRVLPVDERRKVIDFYREIIDDKIESGETEQQAVAELGDVYTLAQKILTENPNRRNYDGNRLAGIVVASFFAVLIIFGIVFNALSFNWKTTETMEQSAQTVETSGDEGKSEQKTVSAPVAGVKKIQIDAENKDVTVQKASGDEVTITYYTDKTQTFTFTNKDGLVELVNRTQHRINFFSFFNFFGGEHTKITVNVPENYSGEIYLHSSNGQTSVNDMKNLSNLTCDTSNASIKLDRVSADDVDLRTSNGGINLEEVSASKIGADSSNGSISLHDITSPNIVLDTSNASIKGNIIGKEQDYTIHTDTSNGKCTPGNRSGGSKKLTADTSNGSISIEFTE